MNTTPLLHMLKRACALLEISRKTHVEGMKLDSKKVQSIGAGLLLLYELYQREEESEYKGDSMPKEPIVVEAEAVICLLENLPVEKLTRLQEKAICRNDENGKPTSFKQLDVHPSGSQRIIDYTVEFKDDNTFRMYATGEYENRDEYYEVKYQKIIVKG